MKLDSKLFDRIRVKPDPAAAARPNAPRCDWEGCAESGTHRAPKGRQREGQYFHFCLNHVKQYNQSYNYFAGMTDAAVAAFQKDSITGHRPTWSTGVNAWSEAGKARAGKSNVHPGLFGMGADPFGIAGEMGGAAGPRAPEPARRPLTGPERRAFETLDLPETATKDEIRARYKLLVKRNHPDAHGGDRSMEERLRHIIQAHDVLKRSGFC